VQKLEKFASAFTVTAWRLGDGRVVYRNGQGEWMEAFADGEVLTSKAEAEAALAKAEEDAKARIVVGPYLLQVVEENGAAVPMSVRERIRSKGPTDRLDLGKQAASP